MFGSDSLGPLEIVIRGLITVYVNCVPAIFEMYVNCCLGYSDFRCAAVQFIKIMINIIIYYRSM